MPNASTSPVPAELRLEGTWGFAFGGSDPSIPQRGLPAGLSLVDTIELPGTTETRGKGPLNPDAAPGHLTRVRRFDGIAWYRRTVDIPGGWAGRRIILELERTKWTQVWLDGRPCGERAVFGTPQRYDLSAIATPGRHELTIAVDNRPERWPFRGNDAHQHSDNTQTNWNGLLGDLRLVATPPVWIDQVQATADLEGRRFRLRVALGNRTAGTAGGTLAVTATSWNHPGTPHVAGLPEQAIQVGVGTSGIELDLPLGAGARTWDEFDPSLYRIEVVLSTAAGTDRLVVDTGLREFVARGTQIAVNGRITFLRGKHDGCVFPRTGHPPLDVDGWVAYLRTCQDYGINHLRCHTWIPPRAAFAAADRLGIYLQPELPFWGAFEAPVRDGMEPEIDALLRECGNHPSFTMLTLGNELGGDRDLLNATIAGLKARDPRRLYSDGSNNFLWDPRRMASADFWISAKIRHAPDAPQIPVRGAYCVLDGPHGHVQYGGAETRTDLSAGIAGEDIPIIGHEIGQFTVYPDFREIASYDGVVQARNLERFRDLLARHGMLHLAHDFFRASGALMAALYQEDMELALRTPGFAGFQLLDLQDFPGQGTALVGILDPFMRSKGLITPQAWRQSCDAHVLLARFDRYVWTAGETAAFDLQLAHYGARDLDGAVVAWRAVTAPGADGTGGGRVLGQGSLPAQAVAQGGLRDLGGVAIPLPDDLGPARADLELTLVAGPLTVTNRYPLWIYPRTVSTAVPADVIMVRTWDDQARRLVTEGRRVVFIPTGTDWGSTVGGAYATDYWCWPMFNNTPGTMGLLMDPRHPALGGFPTASHSERQWTRIAKAARPAVIASAPAGFQPIVQVIDNLERNERLGLVFESRVGAGRLLVVACDLVALAEEGAVEARQLLASLLAYAGSPDFLPRQELDGELEMILRPSLARGALTTASTYHQPPWGMVPAPEKAVDGDITTRWMAKEGDPTPWIAVHLPQPRTIDTIELLWDTDEVGWHHRVEWSSDGGTWTVAGETNGNGWGYFGNRHRFQVDLANVRHVRVTVLGTPKGRRPALRDLRLLGPRVA